MSLINRRSLLLCVGLAAGGVLTPAVVRADRDDEHERARRAVQRGEALPLSEILARVRSRLGGEIVRVSFKRKHGRWVYEFKIIEAGRLVEIYVDAATAEIVKREEH